MNKEKDYLMYHDKAIAAKLHQLVNSAAYKFQRKRMLDMLNLDSIQPLAVCDVGCGEGSLCRDLRKRLPSGSSIAGVDTSPFVLDITNVEETRHPVEISIQYGLADALSLPFPDTSFDIVICANTLKYLITVEKEQKALKELLRVLRLNSQLLVVDSDDHTITYENVDPNLNYKVVKAYAALQGNPNCGSRLEGYCHSLGLSDIKRETIVLEERVFIEGMAGYTMAQNIRNVVISYVRSHPEESPATTEEVAEWYSQVEASANNGSYYWRYVKYAVVGRKTR